MRCSTEWKKGLAGVVAMVLSSTLQVVAAEVGGQALLEFRVSSCADLRNAITANNSERRQLVLRLESSASAPPAENKRRSGRDESLPSAFMLCDEPVVVSKAQSVVILGDGQTTVVVAGLARCPLGHGGDLFVNEGHLQLARLAFSVGASGHGDGDGCDGARVVNNWGSLEITDCDFNLSDGVAQEQGRVVRDER